MSYIEITAAETWSITTSESRLFTCDFTDLLASGETITSVSGTSGGVTLGVSGSADLTIGSGAVNTDAITDDDGNTVAIGKAVQVRISAAAGIVGTVYDVLFTCTTSASNRLQQVCKLQVVN